MRNRPTTSSSSTRRDARSSILSTHTRARASVVCRPSSVVVRARGAFSRALQRRIASHRIASTTTTTTTTTTTMCSHGGERAYRPITTTHGGVIVFLPRRMSDHTVSHTESSYDGHPQSITRIRVYLTLYIQLTIMNVVSSSF